MTDTAKVSSGSKAPNDSSLDIQSLVRRAKEFDEKADWWNNKVIGMAVVAGFLALGLGVAQAIAFRRARVAGTAARLAFQLMADRNADLEKSLTPRLIEIGQNTIEPLKPFAGIRATFWVIPDFETRRAASQIWSIVQAADWQLPGPPRTLPYDMWQGITVVTHSAPGNTGAAGDAAERRTRDAADALVAILRTAGWDAEVRPGTFVASPRRAA